MKKIIFAIFVLFTVCGCSNRLDHILNNIEMNDYKCTIEKDIDTHGGFLGDGDYFAKLKCLDINYEKLSLNWKELPLSEPIEHVLEIKQCTTDGCKDFYERYSIPNIENGQYYFLDRHSESTNKYDSEDLNNRSSWNFTLAILDKDSNIIYYYEFDT